MNHTFVNLLKLVVIVPVALCLLAGGCRWGLVKPAGMASVFPADAKAWPPPAPPADPMPMPADSPPSGFSSEQIPPVAATSGHKRTPAPPNAPQGPRPYSLDACRHLTLTNNPDLQMEVWEQAAKKAFADATRLKMFPRPGLSAELSNRENLIYPYDTDGDTYAWSYPLKQATWKYFVELKWSPTDAIQGYYLANNECNDTFKSSYQRIRVCQKLMGSVDAAFYRLLSMQQCLPLAERLVKIRTSVARDSKELRQDRLNDLEDYLRTEEKASIARHRLTRVRVELERQRIMLAGLMGMSGQGCTTGLFVEGNLAQPAFQANMAELETQALKSRPEAQVEGLNRINSINDLRRAMVKYFPKTSTFYRYGVDYGYKRKDRDISDFGLLFYVDFVDWLANLKEASGLKSRSLKAEQRVGAVALAITSEVRMATLRCLESDEELQTISAALERSRKQLQLAKGKAKVGVLENVAVEDAQGNVLQEEIERIRSVGEANARLAELQCAMGSNYCESYACR